MNILGISCYYHDAAAVLLKDGETIAASEEERWSRVKHDSSFPKQAISFVLRYGQVGGKDLDFVVFYEKPFRKFHRILFSSLHYYPKSYQMFREAMQLWLTKKLWIKQEIASYLDIDDKKILFSDHHLSHAASCFYPSAFDKAAILTVDGVGEWATTAYGVGENNKITILKEIHFPHSIGLLYSAFTTFLGFEVNEGEWKVMGLSSYGKPVYKDKIREMIKTDKDGSFSLDLSYFSFQYSDKHTYSRKFTDLFGEPINPTDSYRITRRSCDIAASIQSVTEELLINMVKNLKKITGFDNLCLAGGVFLNSLANYRILKYGGFKNIYIQPAAGDSGGALGAALYIYHHILGNKKRNLVNNIYLGKEYTNSEIEEYLDKEKIKYQIISDEQRLVDFVSNELIKGKIIGWMQGRFEWGPRALGARSILADPRNPKMKDIINSKVKFREAFRPFAPSVLAEHADEVFDLPRNYKNLIPLRFMLYVVPVKVSWRKKVPASTHIDGSSRPQLVFRNSHDLFHNLIESFYKKTGVPLLLNTSFNLKGKPIVATPEDAYSTFIRSGIDILILGNYLIEK